MRRLAAEKGNVHRKRRHTCNRPADAGFDDPKQSAKQAGLRYVSDSAPGFRRVRSGKGFRYLDVAGQPMRDRATLAWIRSLAIPPAWEKVWICPVPNGHLLATGRDEKHRKQYVYHPQWRAIRDQTKYDRTIAFARVLPRIRRRIQRDLQQPHLPKEKVLAAMVRLLDATCVRVGNEQYARENESFGLTTMRDHHVRIDGSRIRFEFGGKSGVQHRIDLDDRQLARIVQRCQDLPGQDLFQYVDNDEVIDITSLDVNQYLRHVAGEDFTAKDFRTWAGTVVAADSLAALSDFDTQKAAKRNVVRAVARVAERLGNTRTVCRKCYIHPAVIEAYLDRSLDNAWKLPHPSDHPSRCALSRQERIVLALLEQRGSTQTVPRNRSKKT